MNVLDIEWKTEIESNINRNFVYENCSNSLGQKWTFKINNTGKLGNHFKKTKAKRYIWFYSSDQTQESTINGTEI